MTTKSATHPATHPAPPIRPDLDYRRSARRCLCGCGTPVAGKIRFRPGHDARFVSLQVKALVLDGGYTGDIQEAINFRSEEISAAVSAPLASKFHNACMLAWAKMNREAQPKVNRRGRMVAAASPAPRSSLVGRPVKIRIGRWVYDGRVSSVTVNNKGREDRNSEVCAITYTDAKGAEHTVGADEPKYAKAWSFVKTDASHMELTK